MTIDIPKQIRGTKVIVRKVETLIPHARNARTHNDAQVALIAGSIREFGFASPVITDGDNGILAGHGRVLAARKLGLEEVPTIDLAHLSEAQKKAFLLADNRIGEKGGGTDDEMLASLLGELKIDEGFDLSILGYDEGDIRRLLHEDDPHPAPPDDFASFDEGINTEHQCPSCGYRWSGGTGAKPAQDDE